MTDEERVEDPVSRAVELARARWLEFAIRGGAPSRSNAWTGDPAASSAIEPDGTRLRVPWGRLTAEQLQREWDGLIAWVGWVIPAYSISDWPPCWAEHEGLVAHIDGLRRWHQAVYAGDVDGARATAWHESFERLLSSLRTHSLCRAAAEKSTRRGQESMQASAQIRDAHVAARAAGIGISGGCDPAGKTPDVSPFHPD